MAKKPTYEELEQRVKELENEAIKRKQAEEAVHRREAILGSVSSAAERFLRATSLEQENIQEVLAQLGQATKVSRVYIFENHIGEDGTHLTSQRYEWVGPGIMPQIDSPDLHNFSWQAGGMGRWEKTLSQGQIIQGHVREFPASEKRILAPQDIQSIVVVPIFVSEKWWGFIGFDECQKERDWSKPEMDALRTAGAILGALIERKRAEEALRESEKQYKLATAAGKIGVWDWNIETNEIYLDPNLKDMLGYADHEIRNHLDDWGKHVHPDDAELVMAEANAHLEGLKPHYEVVHRMLHKDGSIRWFLARGTATWDADGKPYRMVGTDTDVTEGKKAEEALRESEQKFRNLADSSPSMIFVYQAGKVVYANQVCQDLMGYTIEEYLSPDFNFLCLISPESVELIKDKLSEHMQGKEVSPYEYVLLTKDDERLNAIMTSRLIDYQGESAILGIITDITERKRAEELLRESEEKCSSVVENSMDGIIVLQKGIIKFLNQAIVELSGYNLEELIDKEFETFLSPEHRKLVMDRYQARLAGKEVPSMYEMEIIRKDEISVPIEVSNTTITYGGEKATLSFIRNITERKRAENALKDYSERLEELVEERTKDLKETHEQLIQAGKMAALGRLAGGVAHEINNPLSGVLGFSKVLLRKVGNEELKKVGAFRDFPESLSLIQESALRCKKITDKLLGFARQSEHELHPTDINSVIEDALSLVGNQMLIQKVEVKKKLERALPLIMGDAHQLQQVFVNMILNASDAMPTGGKLTVSSRVQGTERNFVEISLTDTGEGIPPENLDKIFDPFFTTRNAGEGTGLGLSVSYGIIKEHGGSIEAESKVGKGSTFTTVLPAGEQKT